MDDHSRAVALRMIERQITIQGSTCCPDKQFGDGLIEMACELGLITEKQHAAYIRLLSSVVSARQEEIRANLHAKRHGAMEAA